LHQSLVKILQSCLPLDFEQALRKTLINVDANQRFPSNEKPRRKRQGFLFRRLTSIGKGYMAQVDGLTG
jgi:hypothetical protein